MLNKLYSRKKIKQNKSLLFLFLILSFLGLIFDSFVYYKYIIIFGAISLVYTTIHHVKNLVKYQVDLGISVFLLGTLFWFFKEIFTMATSKILFQNYADYAPFFSKQIPINIFEISLLMLACFNFFTYFFWDILRKVKINKTIFYIGNLSKVKFVVDVYVLFFSIVGWIPFSRQFGGIQQSITKLLLFRAAEIKVEPSLANYLPILSIMASSFALFRLITNHSKFKSLSIVAFISGGLIAFLSGTRFKIVFLMLPSILAILAIQSKRFTLKKKITVLSLVSFILLGVTFYQIINRNVTNKEFIDNSIASSAHGGDHFTALTHAVFISKELDSYFYQPMISLFASDLIPRMFWSNKPSSLFWEYYNERLAEAGNLTPSILGQYYLNWGFLGVFIVAFNFGLWCRFTEYLTDLYRSQKNIYHLWLAVSTITFVFLSFRVYSLNYFFYIIIATFFSWFFTKRQRF